MKKSFADIVREEAAENLRRLLLKLPEWASAGPSLRIPSRLNLEQCSSSATARYKASLATRIMAPAERAVIELVEKTEHAEVVSTGSTTAIADLTGGLGADSWAFTQVCGSVLYNEMNPDLAAAVESNFQVLGVSNVTFRNCELVPGRAGEILNGFIPDLIFMDPARRGNAGQKVFRLEDCQPNVLELKEELLALCPNLLLKLSPMADISLLCRQLGAEVREVHCVGAGGECKELLVWIQKGWNGGVSICVAGDLNVIKASSGQDSASGICRQNSVCDYSPVLSFTPEEEAAAAVKFFADGEELAGTAGLLFEPSAVTMKAGCFRLLCSRFGLTKLGRSTQLYGVAKDGDCEELRRLGKLFRIKRIVPFSGAAAAALGREFPCCEVSTRNMPLSSDELRRKMKCGSGGDVHIFAAGADFNIGRGAAGKSERYLFVTERV